MLTHSNKIDNVCIIARDVMLEFTSQNKNEFTNCEIWDDKSNRIYLAC